MIINYSGKDGKAQASSIAHIVVLFPLQDKYGSPIEQEVFVRHLVLEAPEVKEAQDVADLLAIF